MVLCNSSKYEILRRVEVSVKIGCQLQTDSLFLHNLSMKMACVLRDVSIEPGKDRKTLNRGLEKSTASYKMRLGLAKTLCLIVY